MQADSLRGTTSPEEVNYLQLAPTDIYGFIRTVRQSGQFVITLPARDNDFGLAAKEN